MEITESQIIEACQQGNLDEFGELYRRYVEKIYRFVYYRVNEKETAQDLTSQAFFKALKSIQRFQMSKGSFSSWLYQIARRTVIDHQRQARPTVALEQIAAQAANHDMAQTLDNQQNLAQVEKFLNQLTPAQKEIIIMRLWDELPYKEIAALTGKSEAGCKMLLARGLRKIRILNAAVSAFLLILIKNL